MRAFVLLVLVACKSSSPPEAIVVDTPSASAAPSAGPLVVEEPHDAGGLRLGDLAATNHVEGIDAPVKIAGPRGDAAISASTSKPPISDADRVIAGLRPRFRMCYQKGLSADPSIEGTVSIDAKVDAKGEVIAATATPAPSTSGIKPVSDCMAATVKRAQFAAPTAESKLTFKVTLSLQK